MVRSIVLGALVGLFVANFIVMNYSPLRPKSQDRPPFDASRPATFDERFHFNRVDACYDKGRCA